MTDAVITVVGGKFLPSVDSVSDFNTYKDSNLPFLDNKLQRILDGSSMKTYTAEYGSVDFQYGTAAVAVLQEGSTGKYSLCSDGVNSVTIESYAASVSPSYNICKMSESAGFIIRPSVVTKSGHEYSGAQRLFGFKVSESGSVSVLLQRMHTRMIVQ